jgi:2'-5' RNA ligase
MRSDATTPRQPSFDGFDRPACDRIFFAVFPEAAAAQRAVQVGEGVRRQRGLAAKPYEGDRLHVSLHWLGDYDGVPQGIVAKARAAASKVAVAGFPVTFDRLGSFGKAGEGPYPLVLTTSREQVALSHLYLALKTALAANGLRPPAGFTPHMTLLRDARQIQTGSISPISWTVREFRLIHSLVGGHRYREMGRWPLRGNEH